MTSDPNHAAKIAPVPTARASFQSISPDLAKTWFRVPESAVTTTTASEVATAFGCSIPKANTKAGTMTIPPPTPQSAPTNPANTPITKPSKTVFMRRF